MHATRACTRASDSLSTMSDDTPQTAYRRAAHAMPVHFVQYVTMPNGDIVKIKIPVDHGNRTPDDHKGHAEGMGPCLVSKQRAFWPIKLDIALAKAMDGAPGFTYEERVIAAHRVAHAIKDTEEHTHRATAREATTRFNRQGVAHIIKETINHCGSDEEALPYALMMSAIADAYGPNAPHNDLHKVLATCATNKFVHSARVLVAAMANPSGLINKTGAHIINDLGKDMLARLGDPPFLKMVARHNTSKEMTPDAFIAWCNLITGDFFLPGVADAVVTIGTGPDAKDITIDNIRKRIKLLRVLENHWTSPIGRNRLFSDEGVQKAYAKIEGATYDKRVRKHAARLAALLIEEDKEIGRAHV